MQMKRSMCMKSLQGKVIYGDPDGKIALATDTAAVHENTPLRDTCSNHSRGNRKALVAFLMWYHI